MDPVSLIVAALAAGAGAGAKSVTTTAVKDSYAGLKELVRRRFVGQAAGQMALEEHERKPEDWRGALTAQLVEVDAGRDTAMVEAAQQLMALLDFAGSRAGNYEVDARGAQGVKIGEGNTQSNIFGNPPSA